MNYKKIGFYLICLLPWFLSTIIFKIDGNYYKNLNLPFFAPPSFLFGIVWTILYLIIAYSIYLTWSSSNNKYKIILLINYISNQLFTYLFFNLQNNSLALIDTIIVLISSIYLYKETKKIDKNNSKYIIPYIIWNSFATLLSFSILVMN